MLKISGINVTGLGQRIMAGFAFNNISLQLVLIKLSIKHYLAVYINLVLSIKPALINVQIKLGHLGQQLLTTARKMLQHVKQAWTQGA